jgi:hypothetical protein
MKSRKSRKAKQEAGFSNDSRRLNSIVQGVCSLKQKALTGAHLLGYTLLLSHVTFIPYAYANPTGGTVVGGAGTITQSGVTTDIYQASSSMAIDWSSYNLSVTQEVLQDELGELSLPNTRARIAA